MAHAGNDSERADQGRQEGEAAEGQGRALVPAGPLSGEQVRSNKRPRRVAPVRPALSMTSQEAPLASADAPADRLWLAIVVVTRLVALGWLAGSVLLWGRLIGYGDGGGDLALMWHTPEPRIFAALVAAIAYPIVSVGLWLLAAWGGVLWVATVAAATGARLLADLSVTFGETGFAANLAAMALLAALIGLRFRRDRAEEA